MAKEPRNGVKICFAAEGKTFLVRIAPTQGGAAELTTNSQASQGYFAKFNLLVVQPNELRLINYTDNNVAPPINIFLSVDLSAAGNLVNDASIITGTKADWQATAFEVIDTGYNDDGNPFYNLTLPGGKDGSEVYLYADGSNGKYALTLKDRTFVDNHKDQARFTILPA